MKILRNNEKNSNIVNFEVDTLYDIKNFIGPQ